MESNWFDKIGRPRYVVAPMVDASELAWRILCRRHGAELCYTPMFHSNVFTKDAKYRKEIFTTCPTDRPLIVQMLQDAGCKLLTVHGRTREQKGPLTGIANWKHIQAIREAVTVPMFANGNIQCLEDVHRCIDYIKVDGVMSAEGILTNPALFEGINPLSWEIAEEYLSLVEMYPCPTSYIRGHLFKIFHKIFTFDENNDVRQLLARAQNLNDFKDVCIEIKKKYTPYHEGTVHYEDDEGIIRVGFNLILPPWICQPYIRISPEEHVQKMEMAIKIQEHKRTHEETDVNMLSRKKIKKLERISRRPIKDVSQQSERPNAICLNEVCPNPLGGKCLYQLCKKCCRNKCYEEDLDCKGHGILVHTRREMAKRFANEDMKNET
ncbi:tRNA-dihydrouridine(16/17) synthase [NAD(P)(+)]-like isoform X2 [Epargyreus clarus]|uniref:tRNA-dihydrouridine(16/17) synthase [NAD(P)(+)]-like isoform X2 n=1 Tax=Epargyreus clarus TaxID=520877 RepID=UPI003C2FE46A